MNLRVKNWREFQHYGKRRPPWIKLHHGLLDNRAFLQLPKESRALAPLLWLIASERDGEIPDAINEITFRLRMSEQDVQDALAPLLAAEFFVCEHDASTSASGTCSSVEERRGEGKPLQGLPYDSSLETSSSVAARESAEGARTHDTSHILETLGNRKRVAS